METRAFGSHLTELRKRANLTNRQLATLAGVPQSFIAGLQSGSRRVGEHQAHKIGVALGLTGVALDTFILRGLDTCTEKVLNLAKKYPAELLNVLALQLRSVGVSSDQVANCRVHGNEWKQVVDLQLHNGRKASINTTVTLSACGNSSSTS